jgi:hypothetical protein
MPYSLLGRYCRSPARAACDKKKAPERFTARTLYQSSSVIAATVLSIVIPALFTRMSSLPCVSITSAMVRRQSPAEPTLPRWAEAEAPWRRVVPNRSATNLSAL